MLLSDRPIGLTPLEENSIGDRIHDKLFINVVICTKLNLESIFSFNKKVGIKVCI